ncbi:hypothetical protein D3C80_1971960 [compost metagenome]
MYAIQPFIVDIISQHIPLEHVTIINEDDFCSTAPDLPDIGSDSSHPVIRCVQTVFIPVAPQISVKIRGGDHYDIQ